MKGFKQWRDAVRCRGCSAVGMKKEVSDSGFCGGGCDEGAGMPLGKERGWDA